MAADVEDDRPVPREPDSEQVTLADLVRVLQRRKFVLLPVFLVCVLAGAALTALATPQYESRATLVAFEHQDIINSWLESRQSAGLVVDALGPRIESALFPEAWDDTAHTWSGTPPTREQVSQRLVEKVAVDQDGPFLEFTATFPDPALARDVAAAYLDTLQVLRPSLENITRQEAFDEYYEGDNEQDAQRLANETARQKQYWLVLDGASLPQDPSSPNVMLNMALSVLVGIILGVFGVFLIDWWSRYRADLE